MKKHSLIITLFFMTSFSAMAKKEAVLLGYDQIVGPGEEVVLRVKVERARFFPTRVDLRKQRVHFTKDGYHLGSVKSGRDGIATLKTTFYKPGVHMVKASLDSSSKYKALATDNRILVTRGDRPLLVSDIDHTLADISGRDFVRTPDNQIPELVGASAIMNNFTASFEIFYMTARDDSFIKRTKKWLDLLNFPKAPSFFWDFGLFNGVPNNHGEYKTETIRNLREKFPLITIGVGDKPHDMVAYRKNGLRSYYIGESGHELPEGTIVVKKWSEIEAHLRVNPVGSLKGDPAVPN